MIRDCRVALAEMAYHKQEERTCDQASGPTSLIRSLIEDAEKTIEACSLSPVERM